MDGQLKDKVVLITGSTGIAGATARRVAAEGARLFVTSRTEANCAALATEVGEAAAHRAADLTDANAVDHVVRDCVNKWGRLDAVFNVAGISGRSIGDGPAHECSEEGWQVTMDTNVKSMFLVCRRVLQQMLAQQVSASGLRGTVLNMASVLAFAPQGDHFATHAYAASKGAILSFSKAMAAFYAPNKIRINAIAPALVRTPMSARAQNAPEILEFMRSKQPLAADLMEAEDVADVAAFLLGDGARRVTGDVITVDAGWCVSG